jgi:hypothetical protein
MSAHVCDDPTASAMAGPGRSTLAGDVRVLREPSPSWPDAFEPQQNTFPTRVIPQVCAAPARTVLKAAVEFTRTGAARADVVPSPSCPASFLPQQ